jgi:hypothetical protein
MYELTFHLVWNKGCYSIWSTILQFFFQTSFLYHSFKWNNCSSADNTVTKLQAKCLRNCGSIPNKEREFLFSKMSKSAMWLTQPHIQCVPGTFSPEVKWPGPKAITLTHPEPRLWISAIPFSHVPSWHTQGQLYPECHLQVERISTNS